MSAQQAECWSRRKFLAGLTLTGTAGLLGLHPRPIAAEPPPETATVRLIHQLGGVCLAPQYLAEEFLQSEGFTDVHYAPVHPGASIYDVLASGGADISMAFAAPVILRIDTGHPLVLLSGLHVGCLELFGSARVRTIRDLKGKTVAAGPLGSANHLFLASMAAYVGVDPTKEINWDIPPPRGTDRLHGGVGAAPGRRAHRRRHGLATQVAGLPGAGGRPRGGQHDHGSPVAWSWATGTLSASTPWPLSGCCAPS